MIQAGLRRCIKISAAVAVASAAAFCGNAVWALAGAACPDGKPADGVSRAGGPKGCLLMKLHESDAQHFKKVLIVFLHGDNGGHITLSDDKGTAVRLSKKLNAMVVALQRPGYTSPLGKSDGFTSFQDDDYTAGNVDILAGALDSLRRHYPGRRILLVGHSGGSAMTALTAARHPAAADAYLLAGCPCDVVAWRAWRAHSGDKSGYWGRSLSPLKEAGKIKPGTAIRIVVGTKDTNTLPKFSEAFLEKLRAGGVQADLTYVEGAGHASVLKTPEFIKVARQMARKLQRGAGSGQGDDD